MTFPILCISILLISCVVLLIAVGHIFVELYKDFSEYDKEIEMFNDLQKKINSYLDL